MIMSRFIKLVDARGMQTAIINQFMDRGQYTIQLDNIERIALDVHNRRILREVIMDVIREYNRRCNGEWTSLRRNTLAKRL